MEKRLSAVNWEGGGFLEPRRRKHRKLEILLLGEVAGNGLSTDRTICPKFCRSSAPATDPDTEQQNNMTYRDNVFNRLPPLSLSLSLTHLLK
jgi:hypothetical protein